MDLTFELSSSKFNSSLRSMCSLAWSDKRISCLADSWFDLMVCTTLYIHHTPEVDEVEMRQGYPSYIIAPAYHSPPIAWSIHYSVTKMKRNGDRNHPCQSPVYSSKLSDISPDGQSCMSCLVCCCVSWRQVFRVLQSVSVSSTISPKSALLNAFS